MGHDDVVMVVFWGVTELLGHASPAKKFADVALVYTRFVDHLGRCSLFFGGWGPHRVRASSSSWVSSDWRDIV